MINYYESNDYPKFTKFLTNTLDRDYVHSASQDCKGTPKTEMIPAIIAYNDETVKDKYFSSNLFDVNSIDFKIFKPYRGPLIIRKQVYENY